MPPSWDSSIADELQMVEQEIRTNVRSQQDLLTEISMHVIGSGGKRIRPGVTLLSHYACGGSDTRRVIGVAAAFEIIHSATLIHDDINDGGETRRGVVTAYRKYGVQRALIAGDFLFVRGFRLGGFLDQELVDIIADACTGMAESEILQGRYELDPETPVDVYLRIIEGKTAKPIEAGARTGAALAGASPERIEALGHYGLNLGIAFQIVDDVLDVTGEEKVLGKHRGMDFLDGKPTLPLILAASNGGPGGRIRELFIKPDKTGDEVDEVMGYLSDPEVLARSREHAFRFKERAVDSLKALPDSAYKEGLIRLADLVVSRDF
ncbi:MAG: polyprenyl synthetase family protein [Methanomassiliicoccales archaeon]